jgi:hypothetical protein
LRSEAENGEHDRESRRDLHHLDERIDEVTGEIESLASNDEACQG